MQVGWGVLCHSVWLYCGAVRARLWVVRDSAKVRPRSLLFCVMILCVSCSREVGSTDSGGLLKMRVFFRDQVSLVG